MFKNVGQGAEWMEPSRTAGTASRCNEGAAAEADANGEQQLKLTQSGSCS